MPEIQAAACPPVTLAEFLEGATTARSA